MINTSRHLDVFDPDSFRGKIDIIGVGATGSYVASSLAKLGLISKMRMWDGDIIESHNIANQLYNNHQIKQPKVLGLADLIEENSDRTQGEYLDAFYEGQSRLHNAVFLLVDSMETRRSIFKNNIKFNFNVDLIIETRLDSLGGRVYAFNPQNPIHCNKWESFTDYSDEESPVSACGTQITVGPTAQIIANCSIIQFIRWHRMNINKPVEPIENEMIIGFDPFFILSNIWK